MSDKAKSGKLKAEKRCLEIGPGEFPVDPEWATVDWGWGNTLVFESDQFDLVYASHVLEHIPWHKTIDALKEALRILKPGGKIELWVPDFGKIIGAWLLGKCGDNWRNHNPDNDPTLWAQGRIFAAGPGADNEHRAFFTRPYLRQCLREAGFARIKIIRRRKRGRSHGWIDLGVKARKPR